jgi:hypothetical protein
MKANCETDASRIPRRHLFVRRHNAERRAPTAEDPKHLNPTSRIGVEKVISLMTKTCSARMQELERLTTTPSEQCRSNPASRAEDTVASTLVTYGFSRRVSPQEELERPTVGWADMFEVAEAVSAAKSWTGWRARQIQWTRENNDAVTAAGYKAELGSKHNLLVPAEYDRPVCRTASATTRDLEISFFQVPVPKAAWATQRFRDRTGNLYELVVTSMGNSLSAERMTLITLTLGFAPGYSKVTIPNTIVHAHVDNLRCTGPESAQAQWARAVEIRAKQVGATFNSDRVDQASQYEFCGRAYDHSANTVSIASKTLAKLKETTFTPDMTFREWEKAWSRLVHCAQIVTQDWTSPGRWYAMYFARRILSLASHGVIRDQDRVRVPPETWQLWQQWHTETIANRPRQLIDHTIPMRFLAFVDATLKSYGGVLVDLETNQVHSFGALFPVPHTNINAAETQAIDLGLDAFDLPPEAGVAVIVDNSSSEAAARNKKSRSWAVNKALHPLATKHLHSRHIEVFRIGTADMPADEPSRLQEVNELKVFLASANIVAKGSVCGEGASFVRTTFFDPA